MAFHLLGRTPATSFFSLPLKKACLLFSILLVIFFFGIGVFAAIMMQYLVIKEALFWIFGIFTVICFAFFVWLTVIIYKDKDTFTSKTFKKSAIYWSPWVTVGIFYSSIIFFVAIFASVIGMLTPLLTSDHDHDHDITSPCQALAGDCSGACRGSWSTSLAWSSSSSCSTTPSPSTSRWSRRTPVESSPPVSELVEFIGVLALYRVV